MSSRQRYELTSARRIVVSRYDELLLRSISRVPP